MGASEQVVCDEKSSETPVDDLYLKGILNNSNIPVFMKDSRLRYLFVNREFERLAGVKNSLIRGKDDFAIFPEAVANLFRSQDMEVINKRKLIEYEETISLIGGEYTFITAKFPLIDEHDNLFAIGGVCTDISCRKRAEDALQEAEEKYRNIFEHSPLGIVQINRDGVVTASNDKLAAILDAKVEDIVGFDIIRSIKDKNLRRATLSALMGETSHYEGRYLSVSGRQPIYLRGLFAPIFTKDGSAKSAIGVVEDVTQQTMAQRALRRANEKLEERVFTRTEELNRRTQKLNEINVALEILLEKRHDDKKKLEETIMVNIEKLILPNLEKLQMKQSQQAKSAIINVIRSNLEAITSSFSNTKYDYLALLTPMQLQIADLIKHGHSTKEIAAILELSPATIACHRQEIRKRLSLTNKKVNLRNILTANT